MTPLSDAALAELKKGLDGVIGGKWTVYETGSYFGVYSTDSGTWGRDRIVATFAKPHSDAVANAKHMARCSPDTIRALIARLEAAEGGPLPAPPPSESEDRDGRGS